MFKVQNSIELWQNETSLPSIPSFSQSLDIAIGNGGIQLASITELIGLPGAGKTQLCLQLCASVQIPEILGGLNAEALYIDTNTNFSPDRFKEILTASLLKCQSLLDKSTRFSVEDSLERLHYVNAFGLTTFCAVMHQLPIIINQRQNIRLIVIDSIAFPFKEGITAQQRTGLLFRQMADLQRLALEKQIAVVLTNEMSTRIGVSSGSVVGALGDAWSHRSNKRVLLSEGAGCHNAVLLKSNNSKTGVAQFKITSDGIRDLE